MEYLLRIQSSVNMVEIQISVEGDNPCGLSTTDTHFCIYVNPDFLIHPWPFGFIYLLIYLLEFFVWVEFSESLFML